MRFRLIPRDNGFYPLFEQQASTAVDTAIQLEKPMASLPSIVTPFDREDTQFLANSLDDVLDEMRVAADLAHLHQLSSPLAGVTELVALLRKIVEANKTLVGKLMDRVLCSSCAARSSTPCWPWSHLSNLAGSAT